MKKCKTPCPECPFRKASPPGWLGPWNVEELISVAHGEGGLACHMDVNKKGEGMDVAEYQPCVGAIMHANKTCKNYVNPRLAALQQQLKGVDVSNILGFEFREHHTKTRKK